MPATRPRASFEPIPPTFDLKALVEATPNFSYVDRISVDMIDQQGIEQFEKLVTLHVVVGGKPLVIDGFEERLDPWTFSPKWLQQNCGDKVELSRNLTNKENLPLTMAHYLKNMGLLTNQFFDKPNAYKEKGRQRVYLKDIDCPEVWEAKLKEHIPSTLFYLNDSSGVSGGPGSVPEGNVQGKRLGRGIARAGDLMSSLPTEMRAENLMCYIGHEGTYTPAHREMCASLGQNIMVEASDIVNEDGKPEKPGSSIWFMTETKDRRTVSEYWLSILGHDIEVENHFAQVIAWKKAPFNVYVVEQRPGDFILIPPLAPHQVWNRGTRTMKVAWNRTTVETLEMALNEALPRSRIVCRDEQYKNKAIVYYTLQKYSGLLQLAQQQASRLPEDAGRQLLYTGKIRQLQKDFRRLFNMYKHYLLSEMFNPEDRDNPKSIEYIPFDSNVTCAYCRGNIFNRCLTCSTCKDLLGHYVDEGEGDPYDVCLDCYAMGRSCGCISNLKWVEQFRWKELASRYDNWRKLIIALDQGQITEKTPLPLNEERKRYGKRTLAEVVKEQLKRRPWKDVHKDNELKEDEDGEEEEIIVGDDGMVKKIAKKRSKTWLKNNSTCHVCQKRHPSWKMASCTTCDRWWCYGVLWRGWNKMPLEIMEDPHWSCPHCLGICFAGGCRKDPKMDPYECKETLLGHDTRKVADARSVEALVDFSVSNLTWLRDEADPAARSESKRLKQAKADAQRAKAQDPAVEDEDDDEEVSASRVEMEYSPYENGTPIDPALGGDNDDASIMRRLQQATAIPSPGQTRSGNRSNLAPEGYAPASTAGYIPPAAGIYEYPDPHQFTTVQDEDGRALPTFGSFIKKRARDDDEDDGEDISMQKHPKAKKPRLSAAGFRSTDLAAELNATSSRAKNDAQRQFEKEKERKALDKAKAEGRYIMLQAALKGKKRIVKMHVDGARLAQILALQAAKAALTSSSAHEATHEVEEHELEPDESGSPDDLLKSDVAPKKNTNPQQAYEKRVKDGHIVTGRTKKALIPVEPDENYGYQPNTAQRKGKQQPGGPVKKRKVAPVQYEEVDVGSDPDDDGDDGLFVPSRPPPVASQRRNLPGYLQNKHDIDGDGDLPDELPRDWKPTIPPRGKAKRQSAPAAGTHRISNGDKTSTPASVPAKRPIGRPAGKRPLMRPAQQPAVQTFDEAMRNDEDQDEDEDVSQLAYASFAAINKPRPTAGRREVSDPSSSSPVRSRPSSSSAAARRTTMEEENRLAKLQALDMINADL